MPGYGSIEVAEPDRGYVSGAGLDRRRGWRALKVGDIDESTVEAALSTAGVPDPDLLIRTSGEQRLSNFLLWQAAYAEYAFPEIPWPDFGAPELAAALDMFRGRDRRFGSIGDPAGAAERALRVGGAGT